MAKNFKTKNLVIVVIIAHIVVIFTHIVVIFMISIVNIIINVVKIIIVNFSNKNVTTIVDINVKYCRHYHRCYQNELNCCLKFCLCG